nr:hypothetical protein BaRGS_013512 [Batillaria attramentaria]
MEARLTLIEAELRTLRQENDKLRAENPGLKDKNSDLTTYIAVHGEQIDELLEKVQKNSEDMAKRSEVLENILMENTQRIHEMTTGHVSFHARLDDNAHINTGATLILNFVYSNEGGAYNATTGQFTAPVNGTYFFAATTSTYSSSQDANLYIAVDGVSMSYVGADRDASNMGACHLALPLRKGQRVWLEAWTDAYFYGTTTTFTGFLIGSE